MGFLSSGGLRMSDGMSDRASRSASGRIPGPWAIWSRHRGPRRSSRGTRIVRACSSERTRGHTRDRRDGTTVRGDLRSSRARASNPRVLAPAWIQRRSYPRNVQFALATSSAIIHVAYWKRHRDLHRRKSPNSGSRYC